MVISKTMKRASQILANSIVFILFCIPSAYAQEENCYWAYDFSDMEYNYENWSVINNSDGGAWGYNNSEDFYFHDSLMSSYAFIDLEKDAHNNYADSTLVSEKIYCNFKTDKYMNFSLITYYEQFSALDVADMYLISDNNEWIKVLSLDPGQYYYDKYYLKSPTKSFQLAFNYKNNIPDQGKWYIGRVEVVYYDELDVDDDNDDDSDDDSSLKEDNGSDAEKNGCGC
jgi:hypothetical protein